MELCGEAHGKRSAARVLNAERPLAGPLFLCDSDDASNMEVHMKQNVYAIFDSKVVAYLQPFFMRAHGEAVRAVCQAANDPNTNFCRYPADFTLFQVAEYDDSTGAFMKLDAYVNLGNVAALKAADGQNKEVDDVR